MKYLHIGKWGVSNEVFRIGFRILSIPSINPGRDIIRANTITIRFCEMLPKAAIPHTRFNECRPEFQMVKERNDTFSRRVVQGEFKFWICMNPLTHVLKSDVPLVRMEQTN